MKLTTKADFEAAQRTTDKAMRAMFEQMATELAGIVAQHAGADGKVPPDKADDVREAAKRAVQRYFVQERPINGTERAQELGRLYNVISDTQRAMRGASEREKVQLRGRVQMLSRRVAALNRGVALVAYDAQGNGVTPYARALRNGVLTVIRAAIKKDTDYVRKQIADATATNPDRTRT